MVSPNRPEGIRHSGRVATQICRQHYFDQLLPPLLRIHTLLWACFTLARSGTPVAVFGRASTKTTYLGFL
jgi:hypothetical protein